MTRRAPAPEPAGESRALRFLPPAVLVAAAAVRIAALWRTAAPGDTWTGDARVYLRIAEGLRRLEMIPDAWVWPPGYPALGALLSPLGHPDHGLLAASLLAGVALPALLLRAGWRRLPATAAAAAVLVAFLPEAVIASAQPLSESAGLFAVVAAVVLAEWAARRRSVPRGAAAGAVAAVAVLVRPESLLAVGAIALLLAVARPRAPRVAAAVAVTCAMLTAPYVLALHSASGAWALTLKGPYNLRKLQVYQPQEQYGDMRAAWGKALDAMRSPDGKLDPRKVAASASTREFVTSGGAATAWWIHLRQGIGRSPGWITAAIGLGLLGLALPGPGGRERALAASASLPFLAVPVFVTPTGRFLLPLLPGVAWGLGTWVERARAMLPVRVARIAGAAVLLALAIAGSAATMREAAAQAWSRVAGEVEARLEAGDPAGAEALLRPELARRAHGPQAPTLLGRAREAQGDAAGAEAAYRDAMRAGGSGVPLADLLARQGRVREAEQLLASLRPSPADELAYHILRANLASVAGRWDEAADEFARAAALGGPAQELAFNRGIALLRANRAAEARPELRKAAAGPDAAIAERARSTLARLGDGEGPASPAR